MVMTIYDTFFFMYMCTHIYMCTYIYLSQKMFVKILNNKHVGYIHRNHKAYLGWGKDMKTLGHCENNNVKEVGTLPVQINLCTLLIAFSTAVQKRVTVVRKATVGAQPKQMIVQLYERERDTHTHTHTHSHKHRQKHTHTKKLLCAFVLSRLDYCNSVLEGCPKYLLSKLQKVQNNAARLIFRTTRSAHVTPRLHSLHWLPIEKRIEYKLSLL